MLRIPNLFIAPPEDGREGCDKAALSSSGAAGDADDAGVPDLSKQAL